MAKAAGIDAGEYEVKVVELDGSYRKPKLSRVFVEPVSSLARGDEQEHAGHVAEAVVGALEGGGMGKDNLSMSFPCREAVLRVLTVPFVGDDQIRKVIKFEAESAIHSHNVDDMIVDFHVLSEGDAETRVLIAAVPKPSLRARLSALEGLGVEPVVVDLDTMALFHCAEWCGALRSSDLDALEDEAEEPRADLAVAGSASRVIIDLGARSTKVLVVVDGALVDMRSLRTGSDSISEEAASRAGLDVSEAREAVWNSLCTGDDYWVEIPDEAAEEPAEGESTALAEKGESEGTPIVHADVAAARDRYLSRLRLELTRFLASVGSAGRVEAVWMTGGASEIPGVSELLEEVFEVAPETLDVLGHLNHKLSPEDAADLAPRLAVSVGMALRNLGGGPGLNLRQEDLAFTKGFDRIKFPLAVTCMLAVFLALVYSVGLFKELDGLKQEYGKIYEEKAVKGRRGSTRTEVKFYGYVGSLVNPPRSWFATPMYFDEREYDKLVKKLVDTPVFNRLSTVKNTIKSHFRNLQQESGYYPDLRLGSGLGALCELSDLLLKLEPQLGRYLVEEIEVKLPHTEQSRFLRFNIVLRTDEVSDFRRKGEEVLVRALRERCGTPGSSFASVNEKDTREVQVFADDAEGRGGYRLQVRIDLKPEGEYPVFPASAL